MKATAARKAARADIESDLALLQQLLALRPGQLASASRWPPGVELSPRPSSTASIANRRPALTVPGSIPADNLADPWRVIPAANPPFTIEMVLRGASLSPHAP